ncbi:hypothetical protein QVE09_09630 [Paenibacillus sp. ClWae2A]|uniref:hypothetical protein n=1 Tax=Paenibacillus sp. ClWae2A TaxID=3057177 RepID=UPI0028F6194A|nr:hypothetical protein [Paenibacillus sp. ClWae2A]MDT9719161.1 hypothetical protein [Paenibacillus sp. ClWae2A]
MTNGMVKFSAEVAKGISVGTKDVTIKLLIPLAAVESRLSALAKMQEKEIMVYLGDPQGAFDFDDEENDPMYNTWNSGRRVTTDSSGVVTQIEKPGSAPDQDENQAQLFGPAEAPIDQEQPTGEGDDKPTVPPTGADDPGTDPNDPYGDNDNNDIPDWMKDGGDDQSGTKEMDFSSSDGSEGDQEPQADPQHDGNEDPPASDKDSAPAEIDKEKLEQFILAQRPIFDDIKLADSPADFPALLQQRKVEGKTWLEISKEMNIPSSQISSKFNAYKKRVTKMMQDGVAV